MNRLEVYRFLRSFLAGLEKSPDPGQSQCCEKELRPFLDLVLSLKRDLPLSIPLLRELAALVTGTEHKDPAAGIIRKKIDRCYARLCRVQQELGGLDLKKAGPGMAQGSALEDYVFSKIDFSRYRKIEEKDFEEFFLEGLADFDDGFFKKNLSRGRKEIKNLIEESYKKTEGQYIILKENPVILSVMRTLDTSLESSPLFCAEEINEEVKKLLDFVSGRKEELLPGAGRLYRSLVFSLNGLSITHKDNMTTKLFISPNGDLSGTFRPADKPWTLVLIKCRAT